MNFNSFLQQGGPIMYLLLAMSVLVVAIVLLKTYQFVRMGIRRSNFVERTFEHLAAGDETGAGDLLSSCRSPVARVMETTIRVGRDPSMPAPDSEAEIARVGSSQIRAMESWLRALSSIAHLSPFCGLLGTVIGMIEAFMNMESAGSRVDPAVLSGGIWVALLTTAFGLAVAIPAMAAYFYLEGEVDQVRARMRDTSVRVLVHYRKGRSASSSGPVILEDSSDNLSNGDSYGV